MAFHAPRHPALPPDAGSMVNFPKRVSVDQLSIVSNLVIYARPHDRGKAYYLSPL